MGNLSIYKGKHQLAGTDITRMDKIETALAALKDDVLTKTNMLEFTPTDIYHPATKKYVDEQDKKYLPLTGGMIKGANIIEFEKVDRYSGGLGRSMLFLKDSPSSGGASVTYYSNGLISSKYILNHVDKDFNLNAAKFNISTADGLPILISGVSTPIVYTDAANKSYVDSKTNNNSIIPYRYAHSTLRSDDGTVETDFRFIDGMLYFNATLSFYGSSSESVKLIHTESIANMDVDAILAYAARNGMSGTLFGARAIVDQAGFSAESHWNALDGVRVDVTMRASPSYPSEGLTFRIELPRGTYFPGAHECIIHVSWSAMVPAIELTK